jgi:hypothetical protein
MRTNGKPAEPDLRQWNSNCLIDNGYHLLRTISYPIFALILASNIVNISDIQAPQATVYIQDITK